MFYVSLKKFGRSRLDTIKSILALGKVNIVKEVISTPTKDYFSRLSKSTFNKLLEIYRDDLAIGGYSSFSTDFVGDML